jgi:hypothetical protein
MYSGTTLTSMSGRVMGAHQKIDRLSRTALASLLHDKNSAFPGVRAILHFEGVNGPDAIKRKSPAQDEPWHFYEPFNDADTLLPDIIGEHYDQLVRTLKNKDTVRSSFEAAWLAHAIVDGLTPAHHYPYEEKLAELRGGRGMETRNSLKEKMVMHGDTTVERMSNNWKMWGPRGLLLSHGFFEFGIAFLIKPLSARPLLPRKQDMDELREFGVLELFRRKAKEVSALGMYDAYQQTGWTARLARDARNRLMPIIVRTVTLVWYAAMVDAGLIDKNMAQPGAEPEKEWP